MTAVASVLMAGTRGSEEMRGTKLAGHFATVSLVVSGRLSVLSVDPERRSHLRTCPVLLMMMMMMFITICAGD